MSTVATVYTDLLHHAGPKADHQLTVVDGPDVGRACRIEETIVVGTDRTCDLVLTDDRVSGRHLRVERSAHRFEAIDLESRNGTLYEGSRITAANLPAGAMLKLGRSVLRIEPLVRSLDIAPSSAHRFGDLVGRSLVMREVFAVLELAAASDVTVLLEGETGTGKELAARALHQESERHRGPFVAIDCSALPENLIESELFGHQKGAFTGATSARKGAFQRASRGTLFLDELGSVPLKVQARLLRALEERRVRPVGADRELEVDVRVVAASRDDLDARVADGRFRSDLFYRLAVLRVRLPPLRQRREDIAILVAAILAQRGIEVEELGGPTLDSLVAHDWPGNVRELRNIVERAIALSPGARNRVPLRFLRPDAIASSDELRVHTELPWADAKRAVVEAFERKYLKALLEASKGNLSAASRTSGLDRKQLRTLARKHGLLED
ncbi:MAG: sigma 54-interacting transcriptional regulator [Myxococcota bacterium]